MEILILQKMVVGCHINWPVNCGLNNPRWNSCEKGRQLSQWGSLCTTLPTFSHYPPPPTSDSNFKVIPGRAPMFWYKLCLLHGHSLGPIFKK